MHSLTGLVCALDPDIMFKI